jgi:hypothetical protein
MNNIFLLSLLACQLGRSIAFIVGNRANLHHELALKGTQLNMSIDSEAVSRRQMMRKGVSILAFTSATTLMSSPAEAKKKEQEPVTREGVAASFQAVKDEFAIGRATLQELVEKEDFEGIMEFTKTYDLEFRKAKMGKARKFFTSKEAKDRAVLVCNAVTFDLIGMNKGSRPGQQDIDQVKKYFSELQADVDVFLEMEKSIDFAEYGL